jgi:phosphatidylinositol phospholipase C beta
VYFREGKCGDLKSETEDKVQTLVTNHMTQVSQCITVPRISSNDVCVQVKALVAEHTQEWSEMVERQMTEEHTMLKAHIAQQSEILKTLLEVAQANQRKELEARHERYGRTTLMLFAMFPCFYSRVAKDLKAKQTKASIESGKAVNADKTIKNKAEKER